MSILVAYFSASAGGVTRSFAEEIAGQLEADIFEIVPQKPYTASDLKWVNPAARCNREKLGKKEVPVAGSVENWEDYDTVYVGFPIWYWTAPNVIRTFCKAYDWSGKQVYIFASSGGSGIGKTAEELAPYMEGAQIMDAVRFGSTREISDWLNNR